MSHHLFCFRNWASAVRILLVPRVVQDCTPRHKELAELCRLLTSTTSTLRSPTMVPGMP